MKKTFSSKTIAVLAAQTFATLVMNGATAKAQEQVWTGSPVQRFGFIDSMNRSQGMAMDHEGNVWFSSKLGLLRCHGFLDCTNDDQGVGKVLEDLGGNHIGDIDTAKGFLYAPIEASPRYLNPAIAIFKADDLQHLRTLSLPQAQQPDGVPWVAVDSTKQIMMTSEYERAERINVYSLDSGKLVRQIPMSMSLSEVQGGKIWNDHLYMTATNPEGGFAVYDMNLSSGEVRRLFQLGDEVTEVEGLSVMQSASTSTSPQFFVLAVGGHGIGSRMTVYNWKR